MVKSEVGPNEVLPPTEAEGSKPAEKNEVTETEAKKGDPKMTSTTTAATPTTSSATNLQHSPGSASTSSSSSSNTGYTRQSNPRPRVHKHTAATGNNNNNNNSNSNANNNNNNVSSAASNSTAPAVVTAPIISSLPPSAISAAPYIPTSMVHQHMDYHHGGHNHPPPLHHIHHLHHPLHMAPTYAYLPGHVQGCPEGNPHTAGPPPPGVPPPPLNPVTGPAWIGSYYPAPIYDNTAAAIPTFVHHVTPPTPSATTANTSIGSSTSGNLNSCSTTTTNSKSGGNRMSPSPQQQQHLVHPPISSTSFCQNHHPVSGQICPNAAAMQPHQPPPQQPQHVVSYHLQHGEVISLQLGDGQVEVIQGKTNHSSISKRA